MQKFGYFNYCLNVLWSLSVEEVFYFTFPLLCIFARRKIIITLALSTLIIIGPLYRSLHTNDPNDIIVLYGYFSCFDAIAVGCLVAMYRGACELRTWQRTSAVVLGAAILVAVYFSGGILKHVVFNISLISISTGIILLVMKEGSSYPLMKLKLIRCVQWLGAKSYELYLFHIILLAFMQMAVNREQLGFYSKPLFFLLYLVVSSLIAALISRFYAEPLDDYLRVPAAKLLSFVVPAKGVADIGPSSRYHLTYGQWD